MLCLKPRDNVTWATNIFFRLILSCKNFGRITKFICCFFRFVLLLTMHIIKRCFLNFRTFDNTNNKKNHGKIRFYGDLFLNIVLLFIIITFLVSMWFSVNIFRQVNRLVYKMPIYQIKMISNRSIKSYWLRNFIRASKSWNFPCGQKKNNNKQDKNWKLVEIERLQVTSALVKNI